MSQSEWQQVRTYADHLGHHVVLEQYVTPDYEPDPDHIIPIQVYSLFLDDEVKPLFEIYLYCPPDDFAYIEHNCIEIARRKQQHQLGVENPLPLIPRFIRPNDYSTVGFCVLLRSYSYRLGYVEDSDKLAKLGEGPDLLYFNRSFSSTRSYIYIGQILMIDIFNGVGPPPERYALDLDEGKTPSSDLPLEEQIRDQLGLETLVLEILSRQTQEEDRENSFPIGALHNIPAGDDQPLTAKRITPQEPEKYIITAQGRSCELFRLFTVVLDRAKFVSEAGVYFYMADPYLEDAPDDTQVLRGVDMSTIAGRLGMVVLDG
ncbi:hypothetical protein N7471_001824 [Penicillium samsonianum]|uniref:uncharacterized protein n=1 Tax=Penicillium samsonianum TaxID=1882272 RepID=UPI00254977D3|nr:uncharacterized protein N7471_001824 [Penicillium samsonianum]KAJ6150625.1 hypothetical protein N7471_001824 [Penicillium samsonianum]